MKDPNLLTICVLGLIIAKALVQYWLQRLNQQHVKAHASTVPEAFKETIDPATYAKSIDYTLAKIRLNKIESSYNQVIYILVLFSGILPWSLGAFDHRFGDTAWSMAGYLFIVASVLSLPGLPFNWYEHFRLEARFGFNTITPKIWVMDRLKALVLSIVLGYPLMVLILKLVDWSGNWWWLWAWVCMMAFQLLMSVLAPVLILPLFNKFTPLPEGTLRDRLMGLAARTGFRARSIQLMDGSKRSRHSNAFFTGFGRFRKIVLFDTLVEQLTEPELEAVLAHEIGHYKKKHIAKMLAWSAVSLLVAFYLIAWLSRQDWFYRGFGFTAGSIVPALLLFGLLSGLVTFWFSPLANFWSRRYEYQADSYAAKAMGEPQSLIFALRKLNEKNLSNLTPHPIYSRFYYSHPTLLERERALNSLAPQKPEPLMNTDEHR